jgi:hypothetical protein
MVLAQVFFAAMNVGTRLGARELSWSEIAAARDQPTAWQIAGSFLAIAASLLPTVKPTPALS